MGQYMRLVKFLGRIPRETCTKILLGLLITGLGFAQAFLVAGAITGVLDGRPASTIAGKLLGALAALVLRMLLLRFQEGYVRKMAAKVKAVIRNQILDKVMMLGPAYRNSQRSGNLQSLVTDGVESFEPFLTQYLPQTVVVLFTTLFSTIYMWTLDSSVGILVLLMAILSILIPHLFMPAVSKVMIEYWQDYAELNSGYIDHMQGMSTLKSLGASKRAGALLAGRAWHFAGESMKNLNVSVSDSTVIVACTAIGSAASIVMASIHMAQGRLSYGSLLVILFLTGECMKPLSEMNTYWHSSYLGLSVAEELFAILDEPVVIKDGSVSSNAVSPMPEIRIQDVTFRYAETLPPAVSALDMTIEPGKVTAIVGRSGSGKSTIVQLLLRFYDVSSGRILIDGTDIRDLSLEYLRSMTAVVFQETYLFYGTIRENLQMAKPDATEEEMTEACRQANALEFIEALPAGFDTMVGERGATLSGGERQRIAIARALLRNARILLLDEATSSVDIEHEARIQEALDHCMQGRTSVVIAHRLSTIEHADRIYVLEEGHIAGYGTHEELLAGNAVYRNLIEAQKAMDEMREKEAGYEQQ
ncbi:MAG: ABC transporter ATP-binding protein [Blautia sp.]|nr:ABC transporter ATP-binding protein [Blautia sp.]